MFLCKEHAELTEHVGRDSGGEGTLLHIFLLSVDLLIITHHELHGQRTDHTELVAGTGRELFRGCLVEVGQDVADQTRCLVLHYVLTTETVGETTHADTAHGRIVEILQGEVGTDHMARPLTQRDGDGVLIHIANHEVAGDHVIELTEIEVRFHVLPMHDAVVVVAITREVGGKLLTKHDVTARHTEDISRTARHDTHEGTLTRSTLCTTFTRYDILNQVGYAVGFALTVTPEHTTETEDEIGKTTIQLHLFLWREHLTIV